MRLIYFLLACCLSGCAILNNLGELSVMADYSHEKDEQHRLVKEIDDHYDALSKAIAAGHISDYPDESSFEHAFGPPILKTNLSQGSQRWLYRHAVYRYAKDKVYLYFDGRGKITKWEKLPCPSFF